MAKTHIHFCYTASCSCLMTPCMTEVQMSCQFAESTSDNMQRTKFKTQLVLNGHTAMTLLPRYTSWATKQPCDQPKLCSSKASSSQGKEKALLGVTKTPDEFPPGAFTASGVKDFQQQISGRTPWGNERHSDPSHFSFEYPLFMWGIKSCIQTFSGWIVSHLYQVIKLGII